MYCNAHLIICFITSQEVSIKIKKHTDEAVWIRLAWGNSFSPPNHFRPTYVVHHLQTPYVFMFRLTSKQKPLLSQVKNMDCITKHKNLLDSLFSHNKLLCRPWYLPRDTKPWRMQISVDTSSVLLGTYWWDNMNR